MNSVLHFLQSAIGADRFSWVILGHMLVRGFIIYIFGIILTRVNKKLISVRNPFNFILLVMLGSIFAEIIVDEKLFLAILCTTIFLILLNNLITILVYYIPALEYLIKGESTLLIKNGEVQQAAMRKYFITKNELLHELYTHLHIRDLNKVEAAYLNSDGKINFIKKE